MQMNEKFPSASSSDSGIVMSDGKNKATFEDNNDKNAPTASTNAAITDNTGCTKVNSENVFYLSKVESSSEKSEETNKSRRISPNLSLRSCAISIVSIDEDANVIDSESDFVDDDEDGIYGANNDCIIQKLSHQVTYPPNSENIPEIDQKGLTVISQMISDTSGPLPPVGTNVAPSTKTQIGSIALNNSTDVTFGDKFFYEGPVTIQQFLVNSRKENQKTETNPAEGCENEAQRKTKKPTLSRRAAIVTVTIVALTIILSTFALKWTETASNGNGTNGALHFVTRKMWGARPARDPMDMLKLPVHRVIIHHTATDFCETQDVCTFRTQRIQDFHMDGWKFDDIGYNFLIGGDGKIYEGRGWDIQGAHKKGYNNDSIGLALIGTFTNVAPTVAQLGSTQKLIEISVDLEKLVTDYRLYGARQLGGGTESPGTVLYEIIKKWPHWSEKIELN